MTRVGIYGGTFSPPHNGHIQAAKAFMEQMWLDFLYVIPTALPPHKEMDVEVSAKDRLEMCRLAFAGIEGVYVSDMEILRGGRSYTVDTLRELSGEDRRLFLLCGTDMVLTLDQWREPDEIFRLSYPVYIRRDNDRSLDAPLIAKIAEYNQKYGKVVRRIVTDPIELSSSDVRNALNSGKDISKMVPPAVKKYIADNHLYG
ncbi:MAG: nicotinate (nicotinamide) nucleotide adenylyltransferase [Clostridia bacterium]|nr:nicotinate (nicotinamide) nucleotide adenylyltransferase [Clostridia bacterium]